MNSDNGSERERRGGRKPAFCYSVATVLLSDEPEPPEAVPNEPLVGFGCLQLYVEVRFKGRYSFDVWVKDASKHWIRASRIRNLLTVLRIICLFIHLLLLLVTSHMDHCVMIIQIQLHAYASYCSIPTTHIAT